MTAKEFRNVYQAEPFRPFTVYLADGHQIPIRHQEFAMLSPSGRTLIVYQENDSSCLQRDWASMGCGGRRHE
jgi:hypothetical protein